MYCASAFNCREEGWAKKNENSRHLTTAKHACSFQVQDLLHLLEKPYIEGVADVGKKDDQPSETVVDPGLFCKYACSAPQWASDLRVT